MANYEPTEPDTVSKAVANYLRMSPAPRTAGAEGSTASARRARTATRPVIDNRDLDLDEGNDFA